MDFRLYMIICMLSKVTLLFNIGIITAQEANENQPIKNKLQVEKTTLRIGEKVTFDTYSDSTTIAKLFEQKDSIYIIVNEIKLKPEFIRKIGNNTTLRWTIIFPKQNALIGTHEVKIKSKIDDEIMTLVILGGDPKYTLNDKTQYFNWDKTETQACSLKFKNPAYIDSIKVNQEGILFDNSKNVLNSKEFDIIEDGGSVAFKLKFNGVEVEHCDFTYYYRDDNLETINNTAMISHHITQFYEGKAVNIEKSKIYLDDIEFEYIEGKFVSGTNKFPAGTYEISEPEGKILYFEKKKFLLTEESNEILFKINSNWKPDLYKLNLAFSPLGIKNKPNSQVIPIYSSSFTILPTPKIQSIKIFKPDSPNPETAENRTYTINKGLGFVTLDISCLEIEKMDAVRPQLVNISTNKAMELAVDIRQKDVIKCTLGKDLLESLDIGDYWLRLIRSEKNYIYNEYMIKIDYEIKKQTFSLYNFKFNDSSVVENKILLKDTDEKFKFTLNQFKLDTTVPQFINIKLDYDKIDGSKETFNINEKGNLALKWYDEKTINFKNYIPDLNFKKFEKLKLTIQHDKSFYDEEPDIESFEFYKQTEFWDKLSISLTAPPVLGLIGFPKRNSLDTANDDGAEFISGESKFKGMLLLGNIGIGLKYSIVNKYHQPSGSSIGAYVMANNLIHGKSKSDILKEGLVDELIPKESPIFLLLFEHKVSQKTNLSESIPVFLGFVYVTNPIHDGDYFFWNHFYFVAGLDINFDILNFK